MCAHARAGSSRGAGAAAGAGGYLALLLIAGASAALSATDSTRHLHIFGWHLQLHENEAILAPHYKECRYYSGSVVDVNASVAMVTECAGRWYGLVQVGEEVFALPPRRAPRAPRPRPAHALRRRDLVLTLLPQQVPVYNLTDDIEPELDYDEEELTPTKARIHTRSSLATHEDFFRTEPPAFRPGSRLWLELAVVADHTMLDFHGDKVQHYILALMNIVTAIFNERSLGANMTIVIRKLFLLQRPDPAVRYADISDALRRVNKWNKRHLLKIEDESSRWDALVWLTRAALGGGPSGLARMNSVCSLNSSTVVHDEGFNSGFVIAHEIGHLLGLHHDDAGACGGGGGGSSGSGGGSVMSSVVRSSLHFTWSPCSRNQLHIKSRRWKCLHSRSAAAGFALGEDGPAGAAHVFGVDHQCRVDFGDGFSVCKEKMEAPFCSVLYCAHRASPATCYSKNQPPLQGTPCKENHRCMDGECVPEPETPSTFETPKTPEPPAEGVWGAWSRGGCRADCGYGLRVSRRRCHSQSGVGCRGPSSKVSPCYSGRACGRARDVRTDLCRREDAALIPALTDDKSKHCQLWCVNYTGGEAVTFGSLPDGTPCSYDKPYDVCYRGLCLEGSCNSTDPACNWCPRGHCKNYTHSGTRLLREDWSSILDIPEDARLFSLHISSAVPLQVGVRSSASHQVYRLRDHSTRVDPPRDQDRYFKYDVNIPQSLRIVELGNKVTYFNEEEPYELRGRLVAGGALLQWKTTDADVVMWSESQPGAGLAVLVAPEGAGAGGGAGGGAGAGEPVHFSLNFSIPYHAAVTKPLENRRRVIRGPCSASCGGGVRLVRQRCSPRQHACKPAVYEPCHTHRCEFSWSPGEWEECSQTCGDEGVQERQLYCVPQDLRLTSQLELMKQQVSPALCGVERPAAARPCNRIPCPVYWQETDWTPCSATCGPGVQTQRVVCPATHEALCGPRPPARRRRCRLRHRCHRHRPLPTDNTIRACDLVMPELLRGYCKIAYFRKHCGRTCRDVAGF